jgi:hypothetical protein
MTTPPIRVRLGELAPPPSLFTHASVIHGQAHVSRVMVHAFRLIAATGWIEELRTFFARGGVRDEDDAAIHTAVTHHSLPKELDREHPHWRLTSLLKDADGLDRVRLGDLDPRYLRNLQAHAMVTFAQTLFAETGGIVPTGEDHFTVLWPEVLRLQS